MTAPGTQLGPYIVLSTLGQGGMATVYLADDPRHGRNVAIKVMRPEVAEAIGHDRFLREIETLARLTHPHILPLYDSGSAEGRLYYVMPHIEGASLRTKLDQDRQLPLAEAIRLAQGIASALGHAHHHGLVHRDIKPANVMLSDGIALVADFGLVRSSAGIDPAAATQAGVASLTRANVLLGTPQYMAPEQAFATHPVDGRADLYALGCVLFEMLAGSPPFSAATIPALLLCHASDPVPPLGVVRPDVPDAVCRVIEQALAKSPDDRFATAAAFMHALAEAAATGAPPPGAAAAQRDIRIAVLPFENLGSTPDDQSLGDGICDELIYLLGRINGIRVIARGSSFLFRERRADLRAIGSELRVGLILDGSVRRSGRRLRLTAQLVNVADGFQCWSERYDREVDDVFALEDDIAGAIAAVLEARLTGADRTPAANFQAYVRYLSGLDHWNKRTPQDLDKALEHLSAAVQLDETFSPAWGAMGMCYVTLDLYGLRAPEEVISLARAAVDRALRLDRWQPAALAARAAIRSIHDWDPAGAERDFRAVIAAAPSDAIAHQWYATNLLAPLGRFDEARAALAIARELDPLSPSLAVSAALVAHLSGDLPAAIALCERALAIDPTFSAAGYFLGPMLAAAGRPDEAIAALDTAATGMARSPEVVAALATVCAEAGQRARAEALLAELETAAATRYVSPALTAMVHAALGNMDAAVRDIERAIEARAVEIIWLEVRPSFARLRGDARFPALLARRDFARRVAAATVGDGNDSGGTRGENE
jgi:serine/threonine protein kinase/Tfp pilus assembly protein PilF